MRHILSTNLKTIEEEDLDIIFFIENSENCHLI